MSPRLHQPLRIQFLQPLQLLQTLQSQGRTQQALQRPIQGCSSKASKALRKNASTRAQKKDKAATPAVFRVSADSGEGDSSVFRVSADIGEGEITDPLECWMVFYCLLQQDGAPLSVVSSRMTTMLREMHDNGIE
jgi:hypothetical protein